MFDFTFYSPTIIHFGPRKLRMLSGELKKHARRVLLVYGMGSIMRNGIYGAVCEELNKCGLPVFELSGVEPNPRLSKVYEGIRLCKDEQIDFVLAVGGGSVIDCAKAIAAGALGECDLWDFFEHHRAPQAALKIGTVLTHAATGSEMNATMVITNEDTQEKRAAASPVLIPVFSILNPEFTFTVDAFTTACGIADIVAHIIEPYLSPIPNADLQNNIAAALLKTVIANAPIVIDEPKNYAARANIMWASSLALNGLVGRGKLCDWTCHVIEHELSGCYDISHGLGLAILLPHYLRVLYNEENKAVFEHFARSVWSLNSQSQDSLGAKAIEALAQFFSSLRLNSRLSDLKITDEKFEDIAQTSVKIRGQVRHYQQLNEPQIIEILNRAL
jgi:alcohol dehydrogenase YqhD (iron-dependent ADH family)